MTELSMKHIYLDMGKQYPHKKIHFTSLFRTVQGVKGWCKAASPGHFVLGGAVEFARLAIVSFITSSILT